jgi:hypothetical protein
LQRGPNEEDLPRREVRRFELEENVIGSFDYLRSKIVSLYPDLTDSTPFRLLWTDEDGDNVCFSSDEEFTQAVSFFKRQEYGNICFRNPVLKIRVKIRKSLNF